jgi:hypothetical protein
MSIVDQDQRSSQLTVASDGDAYAKLLSIDSSNIQQDTTEEIYPDQGQKCCSGNVCHILGTEFLNFARTNPITLRVSIGEAIILVAIFLSVFLVKRDEVVKSLLSAAECPTSADDAGSYSLSSQDAIAYSAFELLTASPTSPTGYNSTTIVVKSRWKSCGVSMQSEPLIIQPPLNTTSYDNYQSLRFGISSSFSEEANETSAEIYAVTMTTNVAASDYSISLDKDYWGAVNQTTDCFALGCAAFVMAGHPPADWKNSSQAFGMGTYGSLQVSMDKYANGISATCTASFAGVMVNVASYYNSAIKSDVIVCTQYPGNLTAMGVALSYMLTIFSLFRTMHYLFGILTKKA